LLFRVVYYRKIGKRHIRNIFILIDWCCAISRKRAQSSLDQYCTVVPNIWTRNLFVWTISGNTTQTERLDSQICNPYVSAVNNHNYYYILRQTSILVGSITSRCSGKWARTHPPEGTKTGLERAAEIESSILVDYSGSFTLIILLPVKKTKLNNHCCERVKTVLLLAFVQTASISFRHAWDQWDYWWSLLTGNAVMNYGCTDRRSKIF